MAGREQVVGRFSLLVLDDLEASLPFGFRVPIVGNARVVHGGVRSETKGARGKGGYGGREEKDEPILKRG